MSLLIARWPVFRRPRAFCRVRRWTRDRVRCRLSRRARVFRRPPLCIRWVVLVQLVLVQLVLVKLVLRVVSTVSAVVAGVMLFLRRRLSPRPRG